MPNWTCVFLPVSILVSVDSVFEVQPDQNKSLECLCFNPSFCGFGI